jgi:hypothetical protein
MNLREQIQETITIVNFKNVILLYTSKNLKDYATQNNNFTICFVLFLNVAFLLWGTNTNCCSVQKLGLSCLVSKNTEWLKYTRKLLTRHTTGMQCLCTSSETITINVFIEPLSSGM